MAEDLVDARERRQHGAAGSKSSALTALRFLWEGLHRLLPDDLPRGRLIGIVRVADVARGYPSEWAFQGAYQWVLRSPREFWTPLPCRGGQKLFTPNVNQRAWGQAQRHAIRRRMKS